MIRHRTRLYAASYNSVGYGRATATEYSRHTIILFLPAGEVPTGRRTTKNAGIDFVLPLDFV